MVDGAAARDGRRVARLGWGRLRQNGVMLVTGLVTLVAVHWIGEGSLVFLLAMAGLLLLVAVTSGRATRRRAVLEPRSLPAQSPTTERPALSAEMLASAVSDPLIVYDRQGTVVFTNRAARETFGDLSARMSLLVKFRAPVVRNLIESSLTASGPSGAIDWIERVPIERSHKVAAVPVGQGTGLFALVFRDVSEVRRVDRMRADFIANASHELRTPLASISGFVDTLRGPARNDAAARERFLEIMQNQTQRMARLIDDLLSLSRLEMKTGLAVGTTVDLAQLVREVADSLNPLAAETGVTIDNALVEPLRIMGERDELFQVFENLLENACKYGQSGGRVEITTQRGTEASIREARVTIRDFGGGIAAEHIPRITERFYRVDVASSRAQKGTGLGLAIVKHILTRHGGRLGIVSRLGEGSAFTVHLPLPPV